MGFAKLGPPLTRNAGPTQRVVEARTRQEGGKHVFRHDDADLRVVDPARARQRRAGGVTKEVAHTALLVPVLVGVPVLIVGGYYLIQAIK